MKQTRKLIVIMTDTQRHDMLGCYGNAGMHTPCLDQLAEEGLRFDKAYTCQPVCGPARSAIFTGLYPHSNGSWANSMALGDSVHTVGQRLQDQGFHTAYIGKWHLDGGDYFGLGRCPQGWDPDYWFDMKNYLDDMSEEDRRWSRTPEIMRKRPVSSEFTFAHRCADRAERFLSHHAEEDFLMVVSFDEPHDPYVCPEPYASMYQAYKFPKSVNLHDSLADKPAHQQAWAGDSLHGDKNTLEICHPDFFGCNAYVDSQIGRVLASARQHAPDALIVYTSDHGDFLHGHSLSGKGPAAYEEITHIPLIVKWPGVIEAGSVCAHPVSHIDLVPTLMAAAGLPLPKLLEGSPLLPVLENPQTRPHDAVFMEFGRYETDHDGFGGFQPLRAAYDGRFKLVVNLLGTDELYDLASDPGEMSNRIDDAVTAADRDRLHDTMLGWMNRTRDPFRGYHWERRPWRTDARPATWGYTGMTRQRENEEYEPRQMDYATGMPMTEAVRKK
jgi:uncharacterized sulfatase